MTTIDSSSTFARFYDSVLHEIEFGKIDQGIHLLVGMLDAVHIQGCSIVKARQELERHVLHQMLLEDPIYAQAARKPGDYRGLVDYACKTDVDGPVSATGRRLFEATRNLPITRALCQRRATIHQKLARAWKDGLQICILAKGGQAEFTGLRGRDLSNVTIIDTETQDLFHLGAKSGAQFDLICLADVADSLDDAKLCSLLAQVGRLLSSGGTVILSALSPGHLGSGWREVCLHWTPHMRGTQALQRAASGAGFSTQIYSDQHDCFIWAELGCDGLAKKRGDTIHGFSA